MPTWGWVLMAIGVIAVIVAGALLWIAYDRRRSQELQLRFGPEYDRALDEGNGRRDAEAELRTRQERVDRLELRPLSTSARHHFAERWQRVQATFVDDPRAAFQLASGLVSELMRERGYPMDDFDQRASDLSVDHPDVVQHYREAQAIGVAGPEATSDVEELRRGMVHFRALFTDLLKPDEERARAG
jgi:hypothetical protein